MTKENFVVQLVQNGSLKFGSFVLKSGKISPFYIDLRDTISHVQLLKEMTDLLIEKIKGLQFDVIVGIPYTAVPFATIIADRLNKPLICVRKEEKSYGTKNKIIGKYQKGNTCLVIDDVITTGGSKIQIAESLQSEGLIVKDFVVFVDRSANGKEALKRRGYNLISLIHLTEMIQILKKAGIIEAEKEKQILEFTESLKKEENVFANSFRDVINEKKTNLIASLDVEDPHIFMHLLKIVGPHVVAVKTHIDIMTPPGLDIALLKKLAREYKFFIIEDRKFADIGNIVKYQYHKGPFSISSWADAVTVHGISGPDILNALYGTQDGSAFLLAKMSSRYNLITDAYTEAVIDMGKKYVNQVAGYIGSGKTVEELKSLKSKIPPEQLLLVPGISLYRKEDSLGQVYMSAQEAISAGADALIVGRDLYGTAFISTLENIIMQYVTIFRKSLRNIANKP